MANVKNEVAKKLKTNVDTKVWRNYFDDIKRARAFAAANDSKVERVMLDSQRKYMVLTVGRGIRP